MVTYRYYRLTRDSYVATYRCYRLTHGSYQAACHSAHLSWQMRHEGKRKSGCGRGQRLVGSEQRRGEGKRIKPGQEL